MIRPATTSDVPRLIEMGERFRSSSTYNKYLAENSEQMRRFAEKIIDGDGLLVSERSGKIVSMLGFVVFPHFMSGETTGGEVFWWVEPEHRGEGLKLLRAAEKCARSVGAKRFQMIAPSEDVEKLYELMGYEYVESTYQKML